MFGGIGEPPEDVGDSRHSSLLEACIGLAVKCTAHPVRGCHLLAEIGEAKKADCDKTKAFSAIVKLAR